MPYAESSHEIAIIQTSSIDCLKQQIRRLSIYTLSSIAHGSLLLCRRSMPASSKDAADVVGLAHFYVLGFVSTGMSFGLMVRVYNVTTSTAIRHPPVISNVSPGCLIF